MTAYVALLRAVNVGGHSAVAMADLKALMQALGLGRPQTLLQSGNLVFESDEGAHELEGLLERSLKERLELDTDVMVRSAADWRALVGANPFTEEARRDPARLGVLVMKAAPDETAAKEMEAAADGLPESVRVRGAQAYIVYPEGMGRSKLRLKTRGTVRNWNTVTKLEAPLAAIQDSQRS